MKLRERLEALADNYNLPSITDWRQGKFIDSPKYDKMGLTWKHQQAEREETLIRPHGFTNNAIFQVHGTDRDKDIAEYLEALGRLLDSYDD